KSKRKKVKKNKKNFCIFKNQDHTEKAPPNPYSSSSNKSYNFV
ncbi:hypothetical protein M153_61430001246, partial [Pseudoloma neurophilia]